MGKKKVIKEVIEDLNLCLRELISLSAGVSNVVDSAEDVLSSIDYRIEDIENTITRLEMSLVKTEENK
jgi:phage shock protein A